MKNYEVHEGSGNVFADLDLPDPDVRLVKAEAVVQIRLAMQEQGLTQATAAERTGLTQPQVSNLLRGRTESFTLDRLFRCVNALGRDVRISFAPADRGAGEVWLVLAPATADTRVEEMESEEQRLAA